MHVPLRTAFPRLHSWSNAKATQAKVLKCFKQVIHTLWLWKSWQRSHSKGRAHIVCSTRKNVRLLDEIESQDFHRSHIDSAIGISSNAHAWIIEDSINRNARLSPKTSSKLSHTHSRLACRLKLFVTAETVIVPWVYELFHMRVRYGGTVVNPNWRFLGGDSRKISKYLSVLGRQDQPLCLFPCQNKEWAGT